MRCGKTVTYRVNRGSSPGGYLSNEYGKSIIKGVIAAGGNIVIMMLHTLYPKRRICAKVELA